VFELTVEIQFSAAHQIEGHPGPCARLHGHNYTAVITAAGDRLNDQGMLLDFGELKEICREVISPLDHSFLNDLPAFASANPTAEGLARYIYQGVASKLPSTPHSGVRVARVTVYESDHSYATYRE
jgi:6-pyruvoyltetrahydropterin/6-carboxytetrahydropterin synthase